MLSTTTHRPRNLDSMRAGAILYGDLGTSKAYVIGLAFALTGYSSFWLIAAVSLLVLLVGFNYITICKYYPNGGGVYASVRRRSEAISMIGAFFLIADYLVTASLSALSAFTYLGMPDPVLASAIALFIIGLFNWLGPHHTGTFATFAGIGAVILLTILALFSLPHLGEAWAHITPLKGSPYSIWTSFVGVVVALSGIEAIANATGIMKLDPGYTEAKPRVLFTSKKAIIVVIIEVALFTSFFSFVAAAIPTFEVVGDTVNAPGNPGVRDYMLKFLSETFVGGALGKTAGIWFSWIFSIVIAILLLSAVNTAITGLIALLYIMASDGELPKNFRKLNNFGVPVMPLILAMVIPIILVVAVRDIAGLASLYAIGFVGAIATNFGSTSTDFSLNLKKRERGFMFFAFLIMAAIEISLFIDKPKARYFCLTIIVIGLVLRALTKKIRERRAFQPLLPSEPIFPPSMGPLLCAVSRPGKALRRSIEVSNKENRPLYVLYVKKQAVISEADLSKRWEEDKSAVSVEEFAKRKGRAELLHFHYTVTDSPADIIAAYAIFFDVKEVFIDKPKKPRLFQLVRGSTIDQLKTLLPQGLKLSVISKDSIDLAVK